MDPGKPGEPLVRGRVGRARTCSPRSTGDVPWRSGWLRSSPPMSPRTSSGPLSGTCLPRWGGRASLRRARDRPAPVTGRSTWTPTCPTSGSRSAARRRTRSPRRCSRRATPRWPSGSRRWSRNAARRGCGYRRPSRARRRSRQGRTCAVPGTCRCSSWPPRDPASLDQAIAELARGRHAPGDCRRGLRGGRARARGRAAGRRGGRRVQPGHARRGGHARRDAVDVAVPCLLRVAERGLDRRRPADRARRVVVRLAALVAHLLATRWLRRAVTMTGGPPGSTRPPRTTTTTWSRS